MVDYVSSSFITPSPLQYVKPREKRFDWEWGIKNHDGNLWLDGEWFFTINNNVQLYCSEFIVDRMESISRVFVRVHGGTY